MKELILIIGLIVMAVIGYHFGYQIGRQREADAWCQALQQSGVNMKGFPRCPNL